MKSMILLLVFVLSQNAFSQNYPHPIDGDDIPRETGQFWTYGTGTNSSSARENAIRNSEYICDGPSQRRSKWKEDVTSREVTRRVCSYCDVFRTVIVYTYYAKTWFKCL